MTNRRVHSKNKKKGKGKIGKERRVGNENLVKWNKSGKLIESERKRKHLRLNKY